MFSWPAVVRIVDPVAGPATVVGVSQDERVVLVIDNDWTAAADTLKQCAGVTEVTLRAKRQRVSGRRGERLLHGMYRLIKRVAAADESLLLEHAVNEVAAMFSADRVSIALYEASEDVLRIRAARGMPMSVMQDIKIHPGDWVAGRVFGSGKDVTVNDSRLLPSPHLQHTRYRSQAFAVLPLKHRDDIIGVLSITDRRDASSFDSAEQFALKSVAGVIASALAGARADVEMARLEHAASVDSLTGLLNRAYIESRLHQEVARSQRQGTEFAVLMADIDDFKIINDTRGHQSGDAVLKGVGDIMRAAVRVFDVCARWGGDEFAVLMPNSDRASAVACAERIRLRTAQYLRDGGAVGLTLSVGVAVGGPSDSAVDVIARADRALYDAKAHGKDAVRVAAGRAAEPASDPVLESKPAEGAARPDAGLMRQLPYLLVADPSRERADVYRTAAAEFRLGLLVARNGEQAARVIEQFGPPVLLAVDMTVPEMRGVSLIEAAQAKQLPIMVVALSSSRAFREYSASRPERLHVDVLRPDATPAAVGAVLRRALTNRESLPATPAAGEADDAEKVRRSVDDLSTRALEIVPAPGVAVYLRDPGETQVRASVTWLSDAMLARAHYHVPGVVDHILETAEPVMAGAVGAGGESDVTQNAYGLVGAPIRQGNDVIGAVCAFGDGYVSAEAESLTQLDDLAADAFSWGADSGTAAPVTDPKGADAAPLESDAGMSLEPPTAPSDSSVDDVAASRDSDWQPTLLERRRGEFAVARELARVRREQRQLSVVLFDVSERPHDRAQSAQAIDDQLLQGVAETFVRAIRQSDLPIHWSGNELLLVLPGLAGAEARAVAERVRAAMQAGGRHRVAVAGGVAELDEDEQFGSVVRRARAKLAEALGRGHNRVS